MVHTLHTLTDFEVAGLNTHFCLADGHAYQDMHPAYTHILESLPKIWQQTSELSIPEAENDFNRRYASFINSPILNDYKNFRICPTASNSIDIIAAVLKTLQFKTVMVEPTFDNLSLLVRRRGVPLSSIADKKIYDAAESDDIETLLPDLKDVDALFIVHPNNPTGLVISEQAFKNIISFCKKHQILLCIDNCFRVYRRTSFDDYKILIESGISFMAFEDTGKVWPTQDLKASLIYFSEDLKAIFNEIYNEIYLCVSNFTLGIIAQFFDETAKVGLQKTIWDIVDARRIMLRKALEGSKLSTPEIAKPSKLPVEWLVYSDSDKNDLTICQELKKLGLAVLPGRQFFWNSSSQSIHQKYIRVSLMKRETIFLTGLSILKNYSQALPLPLSNAHEFNLQVAV